MKFPCGCNITRFDPFDLPDCAATWDLISSGQTKGIFQVESYLGRHWSRRLKPDSIELLSALIAIIRPGVLKAKDERDISMTEVFCRRRHKEEEIKYIDNSIADILEPTYGTLVFQETMMAIAKKLCEFNLVEVDRLRKAAGKKDAKLMSELRELFVNRACEVGYVNREKANQIYDVIEKSNRYAFNASITPDTLVETLSGYKTVEELKIGEYVKAPTDNEDEFIEVVNKYDHGLQEVYEITTESGRTIKCTMEHKFLCEDGIQRPLAEIIENQYKIITE